jgi:hypothetical protein
VNLKHLTEQMIHDLPTYLGSIQHKIVTAAGGTSAVYNIRDYLPSPVHDVIQAVSEFPWVDTVSFLALLLLFIERCFILYAWYKRVKRGDYDEGKPQK